MVPSQSHTRSRVVVLLAALAYLASAQQVDYYFLFPPDANNIDKPNLQLAVGQTIQAKWHNPGDPINLYLTWCAGAKNQTLYDGIDNSGSASVKLDASYLSDCGDYQLTVFGMQNGEMNWGQPTGSLPFNIVDIDNSPNLVASRATLAVTDTDPAGFEAATAFFTAAVSGSTKSTTATTTTDTTSSTTTTAAAGVGKGGGTSGEGISGSTGSGNGGGNGGNSGGGSMASNTGGAPGPAGATVPPGATITSTTTPTNEDSMASSSGLSATAKVGLGVGVGLGVPLLAVVGVLGWFLGRRRRNDRGSTTTPDNPHGIETSAVPSRYPSEYYGQKRPSELYDAPPGQVHGPRRSELDGEQHRRELHSPQPNELPT